MPDRVDTDRLRALADRGERDGVTPRPAGSDTPADRPVWRGRNVLVLSGVSFLQDTASELLYPILPIFLTVTLGAPPVALGAIEGVAEGASAGTKYLAGHLADRRARRPLIGIGYGLAALGKLLIALAVAWPLVLVGRVVDRLGKGVRGTPRDALLAAGVPAEQRGKAFGLHRAADTAGAVAGPLIGLAAYQATGHHIRALLWIAVIPAVASLALTAAVREDRHSRAAPGRTATGVPRRGPLPGRFWRITAVAGVFSLVNFPDTLVLLRVSNLGYALPGVIGAYVLYNAVYALASYPAGAWADRHQPRIVFAVGMACFAAAYLGLGLAADRAWVWPLMAVYGGYAAATDGVGKAWISRAAPPGQQGRAQGVYQAVSSAAVLAAGLWAGLAWAHTGRLPLIISGAVAAVLAAALLTVRGHAAKQNPGTVAG